MDSEDSDVDDHEDLDDDGEPLVTESGEPLIQFVEGQAYKEPLALYLRA